MRNRGAVLSGDEPGGERDDRRGSLGPSGATLVAWVLLGVVNAFVVEILDFPSQDPAATIVLHHLFELGHFAFAGFATAAVVGAWMRLGPRRPGWGFVALVALAFGVGALTLATDLAYMSERLAGSLPAWIVLWLSVAGVSCGVALALPAGAMMRRGRRGWLRLVAVGLGAGAQTASSLVLVGDYPSAHLYLSAAGAVFTASALTGAPVPSRLAASATASKWRKWALRAGVAVLVLATAATVIVPPRSSVRTRLLRCSGSFLPPYVGPLHAAETLASMDVPVGAAEWYVQRRFVAPIAPSEPRLLPPNAVVVLVSVDSLRADVVFDGRNDKMLPTFARLRERSVRFTEARTNGAQTVYSVASMFAGVYFSQQYWSRLKVGGRRELWPHEDPSVRFPTILSKTGVSTATFPSADFMINEVGLLRGFNEDRWIPEPGKLRASGPALTDRILARLAKLGPDEPMFLFAQYMEPHFPYDLSGARGSPFRRYLGECQLVDHELARLGGELERRFADRAVLIVIGDHGEAFREHGVNYHFTLYDEVLRVPLLVSGPGFVPRSVDEPVALVDLGPTILDLFGQWTPPESMGQSLVPFLRGESPTLTRPIYAEARLKRSLVLYDGMKVIEDSRTRAVELYDLARDPGELENLADSRGRLARPLGLLHAFLEAHRIRRSGYAIPYRR